MNLSPLSRKQSSPPPTFPPASWNPGQPCNQTFEPDAHRALRRAADAWARCQVVREFPARPRPTSPAGEKAKVAA